jgi:cytidylate kinase
MSELSILRNRPEQQVYKEGNIDIEVPEPDHIMVNPKPKTEIPAFDMVNPESAARAAKIAERAKAAEQAQKQVLSEVLPPELLDGRDIAAQVRPKQPINIQ